MKTICLNLQPVNNVGSGISTFANELITSLIMQGKFDLCGCFNFVRGVRKYDLIRFPFKIHYSFIPYKFIYDSRIKKCLPVKYKWITGVSTDINLFFTYKIPRVRYEGIVISTIHDLIPLKTQMENQSLSNIYFNDIKYTSVHSDYIITVSEHSKKDIIEILNVDASKIVVIPNGVHFEQFNVPIEIEKKKNVRERYKLPDHFILYMGGMRKHKNVDNLILAYGKLPLQIRKEMKLVITLGTDLLVKMVADNKLTQDVLFIPFVDEKDKASMYQLADIFSYVSLYEGFGIPVLEAQAAATPVLASRVSSLPEVCGREGAVFVDPANPNDIYCGLMQLIKDKELRNKCVIEGLKNSKKYSWETAGERLVHFLEMLNMNRNVEINF